jgi:hypothetical protein
MIGVDAPEARVPQLKLWHLFRWGSGVPGYSDQAQWSVLAGLAASLFAGALYRFSPQVYRFYPGCPFHELTGLLCPGCGGTRAIAALLHGHSAEAWGLNALVVMLVPAALGYVALSCARGRWLRVPNAATAGLLALAIGFGVVRKLV